MTQVKNQDPCGACTAFGSVAALEAMTNLYFNYHVDAVDNLLLSERDAFNCSNYNYSISDPGCECDPSWGKELTYVLNYITDHGIVNEECFPWEAPYCVGPKPDCSFEFTGKCKNPLVTIMPDGKEVYFKNPLNTLIQRLKENLMTDGPLVCEFIMTPTLSHVVALVGFGVDPENQELYWITKDSYGASGNSQNSGYWIISHSYLSGHLKGTYYSFHSELFTNPQNFLSRQYYDKDHDGYWNWGIGDIPPNWTPPCGQQDDWNDNNKRIGPRDENFYGQTIMPEIKVMVSKEVQGGCHEYVEFQNGDLVFFNSQDLTLDKRVLFKIENPGSAQLNLEQDNLTHKGLVTIEYENHPDEYQVHNPPDTSICMFNGYSDFDILLDLPTASGALAHVRIHLDEQDLDDFEFTLVYNSCDTQDGTEEIEGNVPWSEPYRTQMQDVRINTYAELTITGTVILSEGVDIFVDAGGKLVVDGGLLTGSCDNLWNGIDVWGQERLPQLPQYQGVVEVLQGGMIEFAICGIENIKIAENNYYYSGGIIKSEEAIFKDNMTGVKFWPYHNFDPLTERLLWNLSGFLRTDFITTHELYDLGINPEYFADMLEVEGISFLGSSFTNEIMSYELEEEENPGIGIFSTEATFTVDHLCDGQIYPCPNYIPSIFENLEYGIKSSYITSSQYARIRNSQFINNKTGVYLGVTAFSVVTQNVFEVRKVGPVSFDESIYCGLYLDRCHGYEVQENYFYTFLDDQQIEELHAIGLVVNNSGQDANEIYNNTFNGLYAGLIAQEVNRNEAGTLGLQIKCNNFSNDVFDIAVTKDPESVGIKGIAKEQGSNDPENNAAPAGNIFTYFDPEQDPEAEGNFYNSCENIYYYYHSDTNGFYIIPRRHTTLPIVDPKPVDYTIFDPLESCPSNLSSGGQGPEEEKNNMMIAGQKADSVKSLLNTLVDGGDTEAFLTEIQTSWPEDAYNLYSNLMGDSPYLSDTTMIEAVGKEDVLIPGMITDVLVANPQSAKSENVMNAVDERANPLSDDQLADIGEGRYIIGAKEVLETEYSYYQTSTNLSKNSLVRFYKQDTLSDSPTDSIINILEFQAAIYDEYLRASEYLFNSDSLQVINTLGSIPISYTMTTSQINEYQLYEDYFEILLSLDTAGSLILEMDSLQKETLHNISDNSSGMLQGLTRNILVINDSLTYSEPIILPQIGLKSGKVRSWPDKTTSDQDRLKIHPNPAKNFIIIEVRLKDQTKNAYITIIDNRGIIYKSYPVYPKSNYLIIPLSEYANGLYYCQLIIQNQVIETKKIVVLR